MVPDVSEDCIVFVFMTKLSRAGPMGKELMMYQRRVNADKTKAYVCYHVKPTTASSSPLTSA